MGSYRQKISDIILEMLATEDEVGIYDMSGACDKFEDLIDRVKKDVESSTLEDIKNVCITKQEQIECNKQLTKYPSLFSMETEDIRKNLHDEARVKLGLMRMGMDTTIYV